MAEIDEQIAHAGDESVETMICPCCKKRTLPSNPEVSDELMEQYLACMLTGAPFKHVYKLFKGTTTAVLIQPSTDDFVQIRKRTDELEKVA